MTMNAARLFIKSIKTGNKRVLLLPDRDADGLCGGAILYHTLCLLGHNNIDVYFMKKGQNVHQPEVAEEIRKRDPESVLIIDQGSRIGKLGFGAPTLIIDHHESNHFPEDAITLSGFTEKLGPDAIAPSSLLAYNCCKELHSSIESKYDWLAILGTHGDLGTSFKWPPPFPSSLKSAISKYGRENISTTVSLINAPRRTPSADPTPAWNVILSSSSPKEIINAQTADALHLWKCRQDVNMEVARCSHYPPLFSTDRTKALIRFSSGAQVHPVVASRWASSLKDNHLLMVIAANEGYLPDKVNFAVRVANVAKKRGEDVNLIDILKDAVKDDEVLVSELGDNYARGHSQATGGIIPKDTFERLLVKLGFSLEKREKAEKPKKKVQKTTLFDVGIVRKQSKIE